MGGSLKQLYAWRYERGPLTLAMRVLFDFDNLEPHWLPMPNHAFLRWIDRDAFDSVCRAIYNCNGYRLDHYELLTNCERLACDYRSYEAYKYRANFCHWDSKGEYKYATMYIYIPVTMDIVANRELEKKLKKRKKFIKSCNTAREYKY